MKALQTDRLVLRQLESSDAPFILELLNEPSWLKYIGDKGVRTLEDAGKYIRSGPVDMYRRLGFGLWLAELKADRKPIGICGLLKRDTLDDVDIGFALLPGYWQQGYASEAASATLDYARDQLALTRVVAITTPDNMASKGLLAKLGFRLEGSTTMPQDNEELHLFGLELKNA